MTASPQTFAAVPTLALASSRDISSGPEGVGVAVTDASIDGPVADSAELPPHPLATSAMARLTSTAAMHTNSIDCLWLLVSGPISLLAAPRSADSAAPDCVTHLGIAARIKAEVGAENGSDADGGWFHGEPPSSRGPISPVAPRRTAVAAAVRPADHGLPSGAMLMSGPLGYPAGPASRRSRVTRVRGR